MKRILLTLLAVILVLGLFAAVGYAGYRFGYTQGSQATANGDASRLRPFDEFNPGGMPGRDFGFDRGFQRGFGSGRFPMMGFGFLRLLAPIAVLTLICGFIVWLFTRSGWRLTRQPVETTPSRSEDDPAL